MVDFEQYFKKSELIPAIVQEKDTGEVLMLAYMNRESLRKPLRQVIPGFTAGPGRNCGIKVPHQDIYRRWLT